jgi:hypothetical protein
VKSPDVLDAQPGSVAALNYTESVGGIAAIQKQGTGGAGGVVVFGFPFEAITDSTRRSQAMGKVLDFFAVVVENGDFNENGTVDAADYVTWRKMETVASGATHSQGDANGDGAVNTNDYVIWREQFSTTPPVAAGSKLLNSAQPLSRSDTTPAVESSTTLLAVETPLIAIDFVDREAAFSTFAARRAAGIDRQLTLRVDGRETELLNILAALGASLDASDGSTLADHKSASSEESVNTLDQTVVQIFKFRLQSRL